MLRAAVKAETEVGRLKDELAQAREHVAKKAREIAEHLLSEELRPWFADARKLREASDEVAQLRHLTAETVEAARKAQRDADPFLAKEHELRQAIPQMEDMLKLLRRYQRTGGSVLPAIVALEKRVTEHIEKVRYELERRDLPSDPFLERIAAKINVAETAELKAIEAALAAAEQSGLVDSRHADLYRGDIHRRRSFMADQRFHDQKPSGPVALLERAVALGEPGRRLVDVVELDTVVGADPSEVGADVAPRGAGDLDDLRLAQVDPGARDDDGGKAKGRGEKKPGSMGFCHPPSKQTHQPGVGSEKKNIQNARAAQRVNAQQANRRQGQR
jgi:hypothetical protein